MEALAGLKQQFARRRQTDRRMNFWLVIFLLTVTLGLYGLVVFWQFINRRDRHLERQRLFFEQLLAYLEAQAQATGKDISAELKEMTVVLDQIRAQEGSRGPWRWLLLSLIPSLGVVFSLYAYYFLNKDFFEHEWQEMRLLAAASTALHKLDRLAAPMVWESQFPARSFWIYLALTVATMGLFGLYWLKTLVEDVNHHFARQEEWETAIMQAVTAAPTAATPAAAD